MGLRAPRNNGCDHDLLCYLLCIVATPGARRTWRRYQSQQWYVRCVGVAFVHTSVAHSIVGLGLAAPGGVISHWTLCRPTASASLRRHSTLHTMARTTTEVADHLGPVFSRPI